MGNLGNYYSTLSVFSEDMGRPQQIKILIIKLPRIYSNTEGVEWLMGTRSDYIVPAGLC